MAKVVVVGAGWAGCAAALAARKAGAEVDLIERTDMLLGTGLVGGIMRNNGRYTATEEAIVMGGGELFNLCDKYSLHRNIDFPGHHHASLYNIFKVPSAVEKILREASVNIYLRKRVTKATITGKCIKAIITDDGSTIEGEVFIDCTGTAGGMQNCSHYGNGCVMCVMRCPSFGGRVSLTKLAGVNEYEGFAEDNGLGIMSGACTIAKDSLDKELVSRLEQEGMLSIPIPSELQSANIIKRKVCQQYALKEYENNLIFLDTGHVKLMMPYFPIEDLHHIPGCEEARYEDPYSGGTGNSIRFLSVAPRHDSLIVEGMQNLFCAGEKAGLIVGHTEAIVTGLLAGNNSARYLIGKELLVIPETLAIGDFIKYSRECLLTNGGQRQQKYTFSGSVYFARMCDKGLYALDKDLIRKRVEEAGLENVFSEKLI